MKTFKKYDFWIQVSLLISFLVASLIRMDETFVVGYFVVGAWQLISMLIHFFNNWFNEKGTVRYYYHWTTFILVACMLIGCIIYYFFVVFVPLLFFAPFMALFYAWLCYKELYHKMQRPLAQLK